MLPLRFTLFVLFFTISSMGLLAQSSPPKHSRPANPSNLSSFDEGKTIVWEVSFTGLDIWLEGVDYELDNPIYERDIIRILNGERDTIRPDEKLSLDRVGNTIRVLKETLFEKGYFKAKVVAFGRKLSGNEMALIFSIERGPVSRVSGISFTGMKNFSNEELTVGMKKCLRSSWGKYDLRFINYCAQKEVRAYLWSQGYFEAKIDPPKRRFSEDSVDIIVVVIEGVRYRVGEIKVVGTKVYSEREIIEMLSLEQGDVADGRKLQEFIYTKLAQTYHDRGYAQFAAEYEPEFVSPLREGLDATVNILVTVDEGPLFKIRSVKFWGVDKETEAELKKVFDINPGDVHSKGKIENGIKAINQLKRFEDLDADVDMDIRTDEESRETELTIKIRRLDAS